MKVVKTGVTGDEETGLTASSVLMWNHIVNRNRITWTRRGGTGGVYPIANKSLYLSLPHFFYLRLSLSKNTTLTLGPEHR